VNKIQPIRVAFGGTETTGQFEILRAQSIRELSLVQKRRLKGKSEVSTMDKDFAIGIEN